MSIPNDFPRFAVPGLEKEMEALRELYWLHYPGSGPKATLWDEWLPMPSLWPAVETDGQAEAMRKAWRKVLSTRIIDRDGYVATHQHASIAHPLGWPFPFWNQGTGGMGWHFSFKDTVGLPWRPEHTNTAEGWKLEGATDGGIGEEGWNVTLTERFAAALTPIHPIDTFQAPFMQLRWSAKRLGNAQPYIEWATKEEPRFGPERRVYFDPAEGKMAHAVVPMYEHPKWKGEVSQLRIGFVNAKAGVRVTVQAFFTTYDTRHNINSQNFIRGCATYFRWTHDLNFLRSNIGRMRIALRYLFTEHQTLKRKVVYTDWVGHDGLSGLEVSPKKGGKKILSGHGIGNNYWDLIPYGHLDTYATILYYDTLISMAALERDILANPGWSIPGGALALDTEMLTRHAADVKKTGNKLFWNSRTGRFFTGVDAEGKKHDYGHTFLNFEAVHFDFATPEHAESILGWLCGERVVKGDTSQRADIYHWRFAPRATTLRNIDYYFWAWSAPESIPWGGQVQDGGAVLGWSYHDLMSRLKVRGPDNAWARLREILEWFEEVQAAGGYRKYYDGKSREGSMQGGGTAGGLGIDQEFFESVLVPQVMLSGFLGFAPTGDGFRIGPKLPSDWPELSIDRIHYRDLVLRVRATGRTIEIACEGSTDEPCFVLLPEGEWRATCAGNEAASIDRRCSDGAFVVDWSRMAGVRFTLR